MKKLELLRRQNGLSQRALGKLAKVDASYICYAEHRGMELTETQAKRICGALKWGGDWRALFETVEQEAEAHAARGGSNGKA